MGLSSFSLTDLGSLECLGPDTNIGHIHPICGGEEEDEEKFQFEITDSEESSLFSEELALDYDRIPLKHEGRKSEPTIEAPYGMDTPLRETSCFLEVDDLDGLHNDPAGSVDSGEERNDSFSNGKYLYDRRLENLPWSQPNSSIWIGREGTIVAVVIEELVQVSKPYCHQPCPQRDREFTKPDPAKGRIAVLDGGAHNVVHGSKANGKGFRILERRKYVGIGYTYIPIFITSLYCYVMYRSSGFEQLMLGHELLTIKVLSASPL